MTSDQQRRVTWLVKNRELWWCIPFPGPNMREIKRRMKDEGLYSKKTPDADISLMRLREAATRIIVGYQDQDHSYEPT